ncbi:MAG: GNAT family N-acetyltransferase [Abitibacteriaceae bacterium]|nr:GNAT family N-acetyltransferase [Abditibacteriaceae bacterium]MBV9868705.1 GNAT family N-acetyltransferase [Abditibacteriaceae bacterium]
MDCVIRQMTEKDVDAIAQAFAHWNKRREQYERYWQENQQGKRITLVAVAGEQVVGYANIIWQPDYEPFQEAGIPEINDMNVVAEFQKQGIGTAFIQAAESIALQHGKEWLGIGFGLTADYGAAQRLYPKLGYIPDGRGAHSTPWGEVLYLTKQLKQQV